MIVISEYDPKWPVLFEEEAQRLRTAFGSVASLVPHGRYVDTMATLGYRHVALGDFDLVYPFFYTPAEWPGTHHLHLCDAGGEQEWKHLAFRDYLRAHPQVAREYEALKRELARAHDGETLQSGQAYSLSKSGFVANVLRAARPSGDA
jgi:GrpB-like predicted nucleotidyltransferase (UPF0157 family)